MLRQNIVALLGGALFGFGLALSQMIDPARVLAFLDVTGVWDPTLLFVLGGAVSVTVVAFRFILHRPAPAFAEIFHLPTKSDVDRPLVLGSALFGIGWGIAGYCPGPGMTALVLGAWNPMLFIGALFSGSWFYSLFSEHFSAPPQSEDRRTSSIVSVRQTS